MTLFPSLSSLGDPTPGEGLTRSLPAGKTGFDNLRVRTRHPYFPCFDHLLLAMLQGLELEISPNIVGFDSVRYTIAQFYAISGITTHLANYYLSTCGM